jgi:hypothetical protein
VPASVALAVLCVASCRSVERATFGGAEDAQPSGAPQEQPPKPEAPAQDAQPNAAPAPAGPVAPPANESARPLVTGSLQARWRSRKSGDARDQDLYGILAFDVGDASRDRWSGHFLGRLSADIDGRGDPDSQQKFSSLQDTHGKSAYFDFYEVSADVRQPFGAPVRARIGRQTDYMTPEFAHFDGVRVESEAAGRAKIVGGAYLGFPVRHYDATTTNNQILGAWGEGRPWQGGRVRADWMHVHEDADPSDFDNDLFGLALWQSLNENMAVDARYTRLESENRDLRLDATWHDTEGDLLVQAGYYRLMSPQSAYASEFDPFYETLKEFEPYNQFRLLFSKSLGSHIRLNIGGDLRRLDEAEDEGLYNHEYERGYATFVLTDLATDGLDLSLTADAWNSDDQDIRTWGLDLTWTPDTKWRLSAGSAYALYKFNVMEDQERDDVRTWYARVRRTLSSAWTIDLDYAFENDDYDDYQAILAGATWHF